MLEKPVRKFSIDFGRAKDHSIDYLLGIMEDARVTTLQQVFGISTQQLHWQYAPGWNSIGALLSHIAAIEHYFRIEFVEKRSLTEDENRRWLPALDMGEHLPKLITGDPLEKYVDELQESRALMVDALRSLSFETFVDRMDAYDGSNLAWALYHMSEDEIHHRGQISIIKKLYAVKED